jgi:hypothetical protein
MVCQWLMLYFVQGRIWDQNLCCEAKCLCKTLVTNNMQIFFNSNEALSKIQKNKVALKSNFQNKIIIW